MTTTDLLASVTHDDVLDAVREEATEDAHLSAAVTPLTDGYLETGLVTMTWKRGVWLTILFATAAVTAMVLARTPIPHAWLIAFIPLVIASGGNSGNQSATLVITALSTGDCHLERLATDSAARSRARAAARAAAGHPRLSAGAPLCPIACPGGGDPADDSQCGDARQPGRIGAAVDLPIDWPRPAL